MSGPMAYRAKSPVLLADQMMAWAMYRRGDCVSDIAGRLKRYPCEARSILHGARS